MNKSTIVTVAGLILSAAIWYYLKFYTDVLSHQDTYFAYFEKASGLQASSPVLLKGVKVGKVKDMDLDESRKIKVIFAIDKKYRVPQGSVVTVGTGDISGTKALKLIITQNTASIDPGSVVPTVTDSTMVEMFNAKISPILHDAKVVLKSTDSGLQDFSTLIESGLGKRSQQEIVHFNQQLEKVSSLVKNAEAKTVNAGKAITRLDSLTSNPQKKNSNINRTLGNADEQAKKLAKTDYTGTLNSFSQNMTKLGNAADKAGQHSMITDKKAYNDFNNKLDTFHHSLEETQQNPPPFISIGGSGKKKKNK